MEGLESSSENIALYQELVDLGLGDIDPDIIQLGAEEWEKIGKDLDLRSFLSIRDSIRAGENGDQPMIDLIIDSWVLKACLELLPDFNPKGYEFSAFNQKLALISVPITSILGERRRSGYGDMGPVDPNRYSCAGDLTSNPFSSPVDVNKVARLGMRELCNKFSWIFRVYDSPETARWAADHFSSGTLDIEGKTLTVSRAEFDAFPNHQLNTWNEINAGLLSMEDWKIVFID